MKTKPIDLRKINPGADPAYRMWLDTLRPGSRVGMVVQKSDVIICTNGHVDAIEAGAVWARLPRIVRQSHTTYGRVSPCPVVGVPSLVRKDVSGIRAGMWIDVVESRANGESCMVDGRVDEISDGYLYIDSERIDIPSDRKLRWRRGHV